MTGPEHYKAAEKLLASSTLDGEHPDGSPLIRKDEPEVLAAAQVHATLALAAATALMGYELEDDADDWLNAASVTRQA